MGPSSRPGATRCLRRRSRTRRRGGGGCVRRASAFHTAQRRPGKARRTHPFSVSTSPIVRPGSSLGDLSTRLCPKRKIHRAKEGNSTSNGPWRLQKCSVALNLFATWAGRHPSRGVRLMQGTTRASSEWQGRKRGRLVALQRAAMANPPAGPRKGASGQLAGPTPVCRSGR